MKAHSLLALSLCLLFVGCGEHRSSNVFTGIAEGRPVMVPALTGGKLVRFFVEEGQTVSAGDTLAVLDTLELVLQKKQLLAALRELRIQERIALANLSRAREDVQYLTQRFERVRALYEEGAATEQTFDDVQNALSKAKRARDTAMLQLKALGAKREQLAAKLEVLNKKISDSVILSPQSGVVTERFFEPGEAVAPFRPVVEVTELDSMRVKIYIPEHLLPKVNQGDPAMVRVDGFERELEGTVSWISSKAEFTPKSILTPETRASLVYAVEIRVPNPEGVLKDGMPVEVELR